MDGVGNPKPHAIIYENRANCDISETALPITETKNGDHFYRPNYLPKCRKTHLRNHFWPLESVFLAIATYKNAFFSKAPNGRILKFWILTVLILNSGTARTDLVANFIELGHVETCSAPNPVFFSDAFP